MIAYAPRPGTIPARAIAHMADWPLDRRIAPPVLSATLEVEVMSLHSSLAPSIRHGVVVREKKEGRVFFGRGSGVPIEDDEPDDQPPIRRTVPAKVGGVSLVDMPAWVAPPALTLAEPGAGLPPPDPDDFGSEVEVYRPCAKTAHPTPTTPLPVVASPYKPPTAGIRCALWSDGQLQVQRGVAEVILFSAEETRHLVHYLERMAESADA